MWPCQNLMEWGLEFGLSRPHGPCTMALSGAPYGVILHTASARVSHGTREKQQARERGRGGSPQANCGNSFQSPGHEKAESR